jgi:hypothetical protein
VPWQPEYFSAPVLQRILDKRRHERLAAVPYFDGLMSGEIGPLIDSFAGTPELHHPVRGRIKGAAAFERFVTDTNAWLSAAHVTVEDLSTIVAPGRGIEEVVLRGDGFALPLALAADRDEDSRILELRIYYSGWPLSGGHAVRPPVLQPDPDLHESDVVGTYQRALAAGDAEAVVAAFEPDGFVREPAGEAYTHRGTDELRALFETFFSNGGGIPLEHCAVTDDGRSCVLEYNVVAWGRTRLPPQAGLAVYARSPGGKLASARIYDDCDPPLGDVTARR